ncbi:MAG: DUF1573 domain-containing protein [Gemmataceae bacterium]
MIIAVTGAALAALFATKVLRALRSSPEDGVETGSQPVLVVAKGSLDFGEVWEDDAFRWTVRIDNPGPHDVQIDDFRTNCNCTSIEPRTVVVPRGGGADVRLVLDLTSTRSATAAQSVQLFVASIAPVIRGQADDRPEWWTIRGRVRKLIGERVTKIDFGHHSELAQPLAPQKQMIHSLAPLRRLDASEPTGRFGVAVVATDEIGHRFEIEVNPLKAFAAGPLEGEVSLRLVAKDGRPLPARRVLLRGRIVPDIEASPPVIVLGVHEVGTVVDDTFSLRSLTGRRFRVTRLTAEGEGVAAETAASDRENPSNSVKVVARVQHKGKTQGVVRAVVTSVDGREQEVVVPVWFQGLGPVAGPG